MTGAGHDGAGRNGHDPVDLGAHALGLLDDAQAGAVERHLAGCTSCRTEWEELKDMSDLLSELPPEAFLDGMADGDLVLQRTLRQVRTETGARRRRRRLGITAAAAVVVAAVLGGGVVVGRATAPEPVVTQAAGTVTLQGAGPGGAAIRATVAPAADWVRLTATVRGIRAGEHCRLLVIGRDGTREVAGSWVVGPAGEAGGVTLDGSAAIAIGDVAAVAVENTAGVEFVQVRA